jgi:RNA polymerase sigma-70 factor (ECF subfamily)
MALSNQELLNRYKTTGDLALVGELFTRYQSLVYGVCLKYLRNRDDAKDAVMHLFEKLNSTLKSHEIGHFKSWLYTTTRNHCLMQIRAGKGKFTVELELGRMENQYLLHPEDEPALEENLIKLERCIETLNAEQKKCVTLFYLQEKCYKEISHATGFDLNHVKSYIQNGKRNLKTCLEQND